MSNSPTEEWTTLRVLPIAIVVVPPPAGSERRLNFEYRVDNLDRIQDDRVIRGSDPIAHELQKAAIDDVLGRKLVLIARRLVLDQEDPIIPILARMDIVHGG